MTEYKRAPHQIYLDSLFPWPRWDTTYNVIGGAGNLLGVISFCEQNKLTDSIFPSELANEIKQYVKDRRNEICYVIEEESKVFPYRGVMKGTVTVESRKRREKNRNEVRVFNLPLKFIDDNKKDQFLRGIQFRCECPIARKTPGLVILRSNRTAYNDMRITNDIPPPVASMVMCSHADTAATWLAEKMYFENYTIWGLTQHNINTINNYWEKLIKKKHISERNTDFRDKTAYFAPFKRRVEKSLTIPLPHNLSANSLSQA